ncbi:hypothetical protein [Clostridium sp. DJ247]|uniref:hypothetical protein n=1 Tax=Clostridium sp. DJ247 TaxID=2726188 RepID=UPI0016249678|nr:hypothetical protein [Clostridium sp. DJ247]MBC2580316.1 hypothetical protein [Clostridium sp. DJ247]
MFIRKKYISFIILLLIIFITLILQNLSVIKKINNNEDKLIAEKNKKNSSKVFGYEDIIKALDIDNNIKIKQISQQKDTDIVTANVEISEDILKIRELLQNIQQKENFDSLNKIEIKKDNNNTVSVKADVNFIKNK